MTFNALTGRIGIPGAKAMRAPWLPVVPARPIPSGGGGATNTILSTFTVNGSPVVHNGTVYLPNGTTSVVVVATPEDSGATVEVMGDSGLVEGNNEMNVQVTAPDGVTQQIYLVTLWVLNAGAAEVTDFDFSGYSSAGMLAGVWTEIPHATGRLCIWYNYEGTNSQPAADGLTHFVEVPVGEGQVTDDFTNGFYSAVSGAGVGLSAMTIGGTSIVRVYDSSPGPRIDASGAGFSAVVTQGADPS